MAMQMHLAELERKHQALEQEIHDALAHLSSDGLKIVELKRRKLLVKDEIVRLRRSRRYRRHCTLTLKSVRFVTHFGHAVCRCAKSGGYGLIMALARSTTSFGVA
jgi:hypothetical protein